jgi:hypothetical protein
VGGGSRSITTYGFCVASLLSPKLLKPSLYLLQATAFPSHPLKLDSPWDGWDVRSRRKMNLLCKNFVLFEPQASHWCCNTVVVFMLLCRLLFYIKLFSISYLFIFCFWYFASVFCSKGIPSMINVTMKCNLVVKVNVLKEEFFYNGETRFVCVFCIFFLPQNGWWNYNEKYWLSLSCAV